MTAKSRVLEGMRDAAAAAQAGSATPGPAPRVSVPIAELALGKTAQSPPPLRVPILMVDPKRCRGWKFHNRHASWFTAERCKDLIEALSKEEQQEPVLARKIERDPDFDYEIVYGMRRRFACEFLGKRLKLRVETLDDKQAAVLMHQENYDRKDITAMERALSYTEQLRGGVFNSQDEIAHALSVTKSMVSMMFIAAELMEMKGVAKLFSDPTAIPLKPAYQLVMLMKDPAVKAVILKAADNLASDPKLAGMTAPTVLKYLAEARSRSTRIAPMKKNYNVGKTGRMELTRNARGKVTLAFKDALKPEMEEDAVAALRAAFKDI